MERLKNPRIISFSYALRQGLRIFSECYYQDSLKFIIVSLYFQNCYPMTPLGQDAASPSEAAPLCLLQRQMSSQVLHVTDTSSIFFQGL